MRDITLDYSNVLDFISQLEMARLEETVNLYHRMLHNGTGAGSDFLGWLDLPNSYDQEEFERVKAAAEDIRKKAGVFLVVGIGGSYLGARAAIEMLGHCFYNEVPGDKRRGPKIYFVGQNVSSLYINSLLEVIEGQDICVNVISKSGTTTEPALVFRILKEYMDNKYGRVEAGKRIYATTDKSKGALRLLSEQEGYETFVVPDNIGGRYSVLTSVGLLPMAVAGIDLNEVMRGAQVAAKDLGVSSLNDNMCYQYAALRNILYDKGKTIEVLVNYESSLFYLGEWFKQLFGESEGKDGKGIFPASLNFTTDLHSMGQYIQDGRRNLFETVINIESSHNDIVIKKIKGDMDGLNYLEGKTISFVNKKAMEGTIAAHVEGGVPNLIINVPDIAAYYFGYLVYFFEKACAMSGYLLGVNPFNQPGVEAYKKNMFKLLGKPKGE
ncbi:glucose-6-phosphate isomerase [Pelotomaculum isophthalicicum JI]|uniref:Glucose-6-phosphate isomerase n=1 Tax=Pelotomaculum isophthalicicum JI TaxID=947010 RepID=A0A9X4H7J5_9FIRM|nr:glucose-6-phosphate isomerase [Pelotomaculum isophthalicicum]MDF9407789.1 glucose-6-phosphate isomerase [Pelotomaculum isophthalicicum JI]